MKSTKKPLVIFTLFFFISLLSHQILADKREDPSPSSSISESNESGKLKAFLAFFEGLFEKENLEFSCRDANSNLLAWGSFTEALNGLIAHFSKEKHSLKDILTNSEHDDIQIGPESPMESQTCEEKQRDFFSYEESNIQMVFPKELRKDIAQSFHLVGQTLKSCGESWFRNPEQIVSYFYRFEMMVQVWRVSSGHKTPSGIKSKEFQGKFLKETRTLQKEIEEGDFFEVGGWLRRLIESLEDEEMREMKKAAKEEKIRIRERVFKSQKEL